jgi:hypothetical protein
MKMKTVFAFLLVTLLISIAGFSQDSVQVAKVEKAKPAPAPQRIKPERPRYKNAIGIRYHPLGFSYKNFHRVKNRAVEVIGYFDEGVRLSIFQQFYGNLTAVGNLKWYVGIGAHGGYYDRNSKDGVTVGVDGIAGLDYKFLRLPINISADWQPGLEFVSPDFGFQSRYGGLAVRLAF